MPPIGEILREPLVLVLGGFTIFFLLIFAAALAFNSRRTKHLLSTRLSGEIADLMKDGFELDDVLVGTLQRRWRGVELLLRDFHGKSLGKVTYGWPRSIRLDVDGRNFLVSETKPPFVETSLMEEGKPICSRQSSGLAFHPSQFDVPGFGVIKVEASLKAMFKCDFQITHEGKRIGRIADTGKFVQGNIVLLLKGNFALPVRAYVLAMEFRRMN